MIIGGFLALVHTWLQTLIAQIQSTDPHIDNNPYMAAFVAYAHSLDHFLPITDAAIPIIEVWIALGTVLVSYRISMWVINFARGSGSK